MHLPHLLQLRCLLLFEIDRSHCYLFKTLLVHLFNKSIIVAVLLLCLFSLFLPVELLQILLLILLPQMCDLLSSSSRLIYFLHDPLFLFHQQVDPVLYLLFVTFESFEPTDSLLTRWQSCGCPLRVLVYAFGIYKCFPCSAEVLVNMNRSMTIFVHR